MKGLFQLEWILLVNMYMEVCKRNIICSYMHVIGVLQRTKSEISVYWLGGCKKLWVTLLTWICSVQCADFRHRPLDIYMATPYSLESKLYYLQSYLSRRSNSFHTACFKHFLNTTTSPSWVFRWQAHQDLSTFQYLLHLLQFASIIMWMTIATF